MEDFLFAAACISLSICLRSVLGNSLVVIVILKNKKLQCPNTFLLLCLTLGDLMFSIIAEANIIILVTGLHISLLALYMSYALVSILILMLLAIERYLAILKPFFYKAKVTIPLTRKLVLAALALSFAATAPGFYVFNPTLSFCEIIKRGNALVVSYTATLLVLCITVPGCVMILYYARVIHHVWCNREAKKATNVALLRSRWKLTKIFMAATMIFVLIWSAPFARLSDSSFLGSDNFPIYRIVTMVLALLGSMVNPTIYSFRCPRFRQAVKNLFPQKNPRRNKAKPWKNNEAINGL